MPPYVAAIILIGSGVFSVVCAAADAEWFINHRKAQFFVSIFGRNGARVFYILFGIVLIGLGVGFVTGLIPMSSKR